jgi:hypothetical protein
MYKTSRDWLMWFFLQISGFFYRNCATELAELYEVLYKDEDQQALPAPDMSSFTSVVKMAPMCIWIHINQRSINPTGQNETASSSAPTSSSGSQSSKPARGLIVPDMLRNHYALFQECFATQNYSDFRHSACLNACKN